MGVFLYENHEVCSMSPKFRIASIVFFSVISLLSIYFTMNVKGEFNFEQFFPVGDPDLDFFYEFTSEFETDDNFMLIAVKREQGIFDKAFLEKFHDLTIKAKRLPFVTESNSVTKLEYPRKTPFGFTTTPAIHRGQPEYYETDKKRLLADERFRGTLIAEDGKSAVVALKLVDNIQVDSSRILMTKLDSLVASYSFEETHYLGRPNLQVELIDLQFWEIGYSAIVSGILVTIIMFLIFRRPWGVIISLVSIAIGMLIFMGMLGATGRPLNMMAALYPVLLIIVGTSDVIHIMSKYIDELRKGKPKTDAIRVTIREIGLATLFTSVTTAVGFLTLLTSKIIPIRSFGVNAAIGVLIAYLTVLGLTTAILSLFDADKITAAATNGKKDFWRPKMLWFYHFTKDRARLVGWGMVATLLLCGIGMSMVTTDYSIASNLPRNHKITSDYHFFEAQYSGFRPYEIAAIAQDSFTVTDYEVVREIDKLENKLKEFSAIKGVNSITAAYKSVNVAFKGNRLEEYTFPDSEKTFNKYKRYVDRLPKDGMDILVSRDKKKARISSSILDVGSDTIQNIGKHIDAFIANETNSDIVQFRRTGTGILFDKNEEYVRDSILNGLGIAILIVSLFMGFLFRNWKMVFISLVPNIFPLLIAGALLGFAGIELESGVAIVFAIVFGIAVDDTIHFLSKYKISRDKGATMEEALEVTFTETGKAICLTSIILFFGFLVMLFSVNPPSVTVGIIISVTLASAVFSDLFTIPVLIRWFMKS